MRLTIKFFVFLSMALLPASFSLSQTKPTSTTQTKPASTKSTSTTTTKPVTPAQPEKPFVIVGQMPRFPGGKLALNRYISEHLVYPFDAIKNRVQGKVNVEFVVEKDGSLVQVKSVGRKLGFGLEEQAVKIFSTMPKWIPGKQDGILVPVYMMIPVIYTL